MKHACALIFFIVITNISGYHDREYVHYFIKPDSCIFNTERKLVTVKVPNSSGVIAQTLTINPVPQTSFNTSCTLQIQAPDAYQLLVTVEHMSLRSDSQGECIDFVKFDLTKRMCGHRNLNGDVHIQPGQLVYVGEDGDMLRQTAKGLTTVEFKFEWLETKEPIALKFGFVVFRACPALSAARPQKQCTGNDYTCISKNIRCDNVRVVCGHGYIKEGNECKQIFQASSRPDHEVAHQADKERRSSGIYFLYAFAGGIILACIISLISCLLKCTHDLRHHLRMSRSDILTDTRYPPTDLSGAHPQLYLQSPPEGIPLLQVTTPDNVTVILSAPRLEMAVHQCDPAQLLGEGGGGGHGSQYDPPPPYTTLDSDPLPSYHSLFPHVRPDTDNKQS